ncbi:MAG: ZIP family metal transporter [Geothrix sp.]|nr:ZIP family metal transporter [Geothrix sp.]
MASIVPILIAALLVGPGSIALGSLVLRLPEARLQKLAPRVLSFATGALLGMVFLRMLPKALEGPAGQPILGTVLAVILGLFVMERLRIMRHCHEPGCPEHSDMTVKVFLGNAVHNLVDGLALALAFQASTPMGWIMALALLGHEIPKGLVNLLMLKETDNAAVSILWNGLASTFTVLGALAAAVAFPLVAGSVPYALAIGSAVFLYMALADLVPRHRRRMPLSEAALQSVLVLAGAGLLLLFSHHQG